MNYDENNIIEIVEFINGELAKGRSMIDIEKNEFNVNERVITKRLKRKGYVKVNNQFEIKEGSTVKDDNVKTRVINSKSSVKLNDKDMTKVISKEPKVNVSINKNDQEKLIYLFDNFDKLKELIETDVKDMTKVINIELEEETDFNFRTTVRVNNVVWNRFKKFIDKHKEFTQKDLLSQAISDFMNRYE